MGDNLENNEEIKVDVLMVTYNQEKYISQAIESVLMQKCSFKMLFVYVWHEGSKFFLKQPVDQKNCLSIFIAY